MTNIEMTTVEEFDIEINKLLKKVVNPFQSKKKKLLIVSDMCLLCAQAHRNNIIKDEEMDEWFTKVFGKYGFKKEDYMEKVN